MTGLSYRLRLRMAWELTWPLALLDFLLVFVFHGIFDTAAETWDSIWAVVSFLAVSPWVVRRALRRRYGRLRVVVSGSPRALRYQESLKVMWLLAWRTLVLSLVSLLVISLVLRLAGLRSRAFTNEDPLWNSLGLSAADAVSSLVFAPLLIPGMLRKRFKGFHLELVTTGGKLLR